MLSPLKTSIRWYDMVGMFALAMLFRGLCFTVIGDSPLLTHPVVDAGSYDQWALRIAAGNILGHGPDDVFRPPLYPYFLAVCYRLFGHNIVAVQWIHYVLGGLSCVLLSILTGRFLGRRVAIVTGVLASLYAPAVFFESQLLTPALAIFLNLLGTLMLVASIRRGTSVHWGWALGAGLAFGLSAGVRPDSLLPVGLIVLWLVTRSQEIPWAPRLGWAACVIGGILLVITPITVRNAVVSGNFVPIASNAGINLYVGNRHGADGLSACPVGIRWEQLVSQVPQSVLEQPAAASRWWMKQTLIEVAARPGESLTRLGTKAVAFLNQREIRNNIGFAFMQERAWPLRWPFVQFWMILPLACYGFYRLFGSARMRGRRIGVLCLLWTVGYWGIGIIFFMTARYRMPAIPFLLIPAGFSVMALAEAVRKRQKRTLQIAAVIIGVVATLTWLPWPAPDTNAEGVRDYVNLGNAYQAGGQREAAEDAYRRALALADDPDAHYLLGQLLLKDGDNGTARSHFEKALKIVPESPDVLLARAQAQLRLGQLKAGLDTLRQLDDLAKYKNLWPKRSTWARALFMLSELEEPLHQHELRQRAWAVDPHTMAEIALLWDRELERATDVFLETCDREPWNWYAQANLGMVYLQQGKAHAALPHFRKAVRLNPAKEGLQFQLARALVAAGEEEEAAKILADSMGRLPDCRLRDDVETLLDFVRENKIARKLDTETK
ncbi:MAG: tetratricopeptide repeat protein [Candidatus Pacebacteria bacterium]|nr:tetratricopeptide repeat protein [Candidatus Paceibacterota bacterium]